MQSGRFVEAEAGVVGEAEASEAVVSPGEAHQDFADAGDSATVGAGRTDRASLSLRD